MDLLSILSYGSLDGFFINVERVKYGWMDLCVGTNQKHINYTVGYVCNPLVDLLDAGIAIIKHEQADQLGDDYKYNYGCIGNYHYVDHDLEGNDVVWLFKVIGENLTLIIWNSTLNFDDFITLLEADFDSEDVRIKMLSKTPNITEDLALALRGSTITFIEAVKNALKNLPIADKDNEEGNFNNWGFDHSIDKLNLLTEWLIEQGIKN
jgi:hypothetical protein